MEIALSQSQLPAIPITLEQSLSFLLSLLRTLWLALLKRHCDPRYPTHRHCESVEHGRSNPVKKYGKINGLDGFVCYQTRSDAQTGKSSSRAIASSVNVAIFFHLDCFVCKANSQWRTRRGGLLRPVNSLWRMKVAHQTHLVRIKKGIVKSLTFS